MWQGAWCWESICHDASASANASDGVKEGVDLSSVNSVGGGCRCLGVRMWICYLSCRHTS